MIYKILFLINPVSGISNKQRIKDLIHRRIDKSKFDYDVLFTEYAGHGVELSETAISENHDAVIVVGGDGSVNEVGSALVNTKVALGIIPTGSGNGLAHHLKLPFNLARSIENINKYQISRIDTLEINNHFCVNIAGVGFDAKVALEFSKAKRRGFWSYFQIILHEYPKYKALDYTLTFDNQVVRKNALLVCFANSNQFGNGVVIAPKASLTDGILDVCIMSKVPLVQAPVLGQVLFLKLINKTHYVEYIRTKQIKLSQQQDQVAHIDGDPIFLGKEIHVKVNPLSLNVIASS